MGWAEDQIKKERAEEESRAVDKELHLREERAKDEVGPGCFKKVKIYVEAEIDKYNGARPNSSSEGMAFIPDTSMEEEQDFMSKIPSFTIRKKDGRYAYVYVSYRQHGHVLQWKCGGAEGSYALRTRPNGVGYFVGSDSIEKTPEQIGNELLNRLIRAELRGGIVWG